MIYQASTRDIKVQVETRFEIDASKPSQDKYLHSYFVTIINESSNTVQLLRRKWMIKNTRNQTKVIEGDGVIGEQPILHPGDKHHYKSWSPIATPIGQMYGQYKMLNTSTQEVFWIDIPRFDLIAPFKLN